MNIPDEIKRLCLQLSLQGKTCKEIAAVLGVSKSSVGNWRKASLLRFRACGEHRRTNFFNENFFEEVNSHEKAYWLGFIFADGSIDQKTWTLQIGLAQKDRNTLEKFVISIGGHLSLIKDYAKKHPFSRLRLHSKKMYQDMCNLGMCPRKSLVIKPPNISKEFFWSFILGYFDGDGCIYKNANRVDLACSRSMAEWMCDFFHQNSIKSRVAPHGKIFYVQVFGLRNIREFQKRAYFYPCPFMERKRQIFESKKQETLKEKQERELAIVISHMSNKTYSEIALVTGLSVNRVHHLIKCHYKKS